LNKVITIHYLRGIASLLVVAYHNKTSGYEVLGNHNIFEYLFKGGAFGVDLFFIISGFIIAFSTQENKEHNLLNFTIKRIFRIYPIFLVAITLYILVHPAYTFYEILRSYIFINRDYDKAAPYFGYNVLFPAWSLSYEVYFYIVFCMAMSISHQKRILITSAVLIIPALILQLYYNNGISFNGSMRLQNSDFAFLNFFASPMLYEFIVGMMFFYLVRLFDNVKHYKYICFLLFFSFLFCYLTTFNYTVGLSGFGTWSILLIAAGLMLERNHVIGKNKILSFFGDISYSLYLVHAIVMQVLIKYHVYVPFYNKNSLSKFLVIMISSILFAWVLHEIVEKPMLRAGRTALINIIKFRKK